MIRVVVQLREEAGSVNVGVSAISLSEPRSIELDGSRTIQHGSERKIDTILYIGHSQLVFLLAHAPDAVSLRY